MVENIRDFIDFLGSEEENQITSCANLGEHFFLIHNLDILYLEVLKIKIDIKKDDHMASAILFCNIHRKFYLSMANFLRLHYAESFVNLRAAIDSVFTAYYLLKNPDRVKIYLASTQEDSETKKEWDKIFRNIKGTIKKNIDDYPYAKGLVEGHEFCSRFAHSDASDILRYLEDTSSTTKPLIEYTYFDYAEGKKWLEALLSGFFKIYTLFWTIFFKEQASEEISEVVTTRTEAFKKEFKQKYPQAP